MVFVSSALRKLPTTWQKEFSTTGAASAFSSLLSCDKIYCEWFVFISALVLSLNDPLKKHLTELTSCPN
jgi:hypothetical protein